MTPSRSKGWHKKWTLIDPGDLSRWRHESSLIAHVLTDQSSGEPFATPENVAAWIAASTHVPSETIRARLAALMQEARDVYAYRKAKHDYDIRKAQKLAR